MAASLIIEEESGTYTGQVHPHNGYYAGDFWDRPNDAQASTPAVTGIRRHRPPPEERIMHSIIDIHPKPPPRSPSSASVSATPKLCQSVREVQRAPRAQSSMSRSRRPWRVRTIRRAFA